MLIYPVAVKCEYVIDASNNKKIVARTVLKWSYQKLSGLLVEILRDRLEYQGAWLDDIYILFGFDHNGKKYPIRFFSIFLDPDFLDDYDEKIKKSDILDDVVDVNRSIFIFDYTHRGGFDPDEYDGNPFKRPMINRLLNIVFYNAAMVAQEKIRENKNNHIW